MSRRAYPLPEAAAELGVSVKTLRREIRDGRLRAKRIRGVVVVLSSEIDRYLAAAPDELALVPAVSRAAIKPQLPTGPRGRVQRRFSIMEA